MDSPIITVVSGLAGTGKTTWICQQLSAIQATPKVVYLSPGNGTVAIDPIRLMAEFPSLTVLSDTEIGDLHHHLDTADAVYMEVGFHLKLGAVEELLGGLRYRAIALVPLHLTTSEYHSWADEIIPSAVSTNLAQPHLCRFSTTGQVIDDSSLAEAWYEITQGAYGEVVRAKGIFDIADGKSVYADFVAGVESQDFQELNVVSHYLSKSSRCSGVEIWGESLDEESLQKTLSDCCLSASAISAYKQQMLEEIEA